MITAILGGYLLGSLPTADFLARSRGIDLRRRGTGNPGAANALRVGGKGLGVAVLAADLVKGGAAALLGWAVADQGGAAAAAVAAVLGQVRNPWFRLRGGKGLGVAGGTVLVIWPVGAAVVAPILGVASRALGTAAGSLIGLATLLVGATVWAAHDLAMGWGIAPDDRLVWFAIGVVVVVAPKFFADLGREKT